MLVNAHSYLITGATGFIGAELTRQLQATGAKGKILCRNTTKGQLLEQGQNLQIIPGDLTDTASLNPACEGVDCVLHLAGLAHVNQPDPSLLWQINVEGTRNLLKAALENKVKRLVYFSSSLAQACEQGQPDVTEYGQTKLAAERLLLDSHQRGEIEVVIIRPVNVYGAGMKGNISTLIGLIQRRRLPPLPKLQNKISLIGVTDLAQAAILAANKQQASGQVYLVTDGEEYGINDIENAIYHYFGRKTPSLRSPRMLLYGAAALAELASKITGSSRSIGIRTYHNLTRDNCFSNQAIATDLGFKASTNLYQQLPQISQFLGR